MLRVVGTLDQFILDASPFFGVYVKGKMYSYITELPDVFGAYYDSLYP